MSNPFYAKRGHYVQSVRLPDAFDKKMGRLTDSIYRFFPNSKRYRQATNKNYSCLVLQFFPVSFLTRFRTVREDDLIETFKRGTGSLEDDIWEKEDRHKVCLRSEPG